MRNSVAAVLLLMCPVLALADKYGISEAASEGGPVPGWLLPLAFVALLIYHLHDHSKLDGQRVRESFAHEQTSKRLSEVHRKLAATQHELEELERKYSSLHGGVQQYFEGLTTDEEFAAAMEPFLEPIEYSTFKAPEAQLQR